MPITSHGVAHGMINRARARPRPMKRWLSSIAIASPITVDRTTKPMAKVSVTCAERQNTGLEKMMVKFSMPTNGPKLEPLAGTSCRL
jgi:hypothetical protein